MCRICIFSFLVNFNCPTVIQTISALVAATATGVIAWATYRNWKTTEKLADATQAQKDISQSLKDLSLESRKPLIEVYIAAIHRRPINRLLYLVIENHGHGMASEVELTFAGDISISEHRSLVGYYRAETGGKPFVLQPVSKYEIAITDDSVTTETILKEGRRFTGILRYKWSGGDSGSIPIEVSLADSDVKHR